jgi:hypothetical protein
MILSTHLKRLETRLFTADCISEFQKMQHTTVYSTNRPSIPTDLHTIYATYTIAKTDLTKCPFRFQT